MDAQEDLESLMMMISPILRNEVTQHLFLNVLKSINVFKGSNDIVDFIVQNIEAKSYMAEDYIIKQGQKGTTLYILANGECDVLVRD